MSKILKDKGICLVALYVNVYGPYYYGVLKFENAKKLEEIFTEISKEILEERENEEKNVNPDIIV